MSTRATASATLAGSTPAAASPAWTNRGGWIAAATVVLALSLLAAIFAPILHHQPLAPADDADYYRVIARNIARSGASTFDGQVLTNGYHPLWTWVLAIQDKLFGDSILVTYLIEAALVTAAFPLFLLRSGLRTPLAVVVVLALFGRLVAGLTLTGMEVSILVGTTGLLVWLLGREGPEDPWRTGGVLGVALAAVVLARIDAAVFALPLVAFAPLKRSTRLVAFGVAGAIGAAYVAYNVALFGTPLPISSGVKSLGGLQINHRLLNQMVNEARTSGVMGRDLQTFGLLLLSPLFLLASRPNTLGRALAGATVVGGAAFVAKLVFGSSWQIWLWYNFPVLFALMAATFTLGPRLEAFAAERARAAPLAAAITAAVAAVILLGLTARAALVLVRPHPLEPDRFDVVSEEAARRFAPVLKGQRVAMGDRAGSFADVYPGGVTQLEGLVNDRAWLAALKAGAPLKPILCARGVRFVIAYQKELGDYRDVAIPAMRPRLTQFPGPALTLSRADEVGHFSDRAVFDLRDNKDEEGDDVFYLWRLDCEPHRSS